MAINPGIIIALTIVLATIFLLLNKKKRSAPSNSALGVVGPNGKLKVVLKERQTLSHDTFNFVFKLPKEEQIFGVPVGNHYIIHAKVNGEDVSRKYTPTSVVNQKGTFEQVIKIYRPNVHPKFPEGGQLTPYLEKLPIGSEVEITGPHGHLEYFGNGQCVINRKLENGKIQKKTFKKMYMIAGGTGLTPMYQIIQQVCNDPNDNTELYLLYANKAEEDILLRKELENYAKDKRFKLFYTLDTPPEGWKHFGGFVTADMLKQCFPERDDKILCCSCGPVPMTNLARKLFLELGFKEENYYKF
ncbi:hypothetical protein ABPG74_014870 [Tetrahymena malaccensis]